MSYNGNALVLLIMKSLILSMQMSKSYNCLLCQTSSHLLYYRKQVHGSVELSLLPVLVQPLLVHPAQITDIM
jgi:hypothetical protein